MYKLYAAPVILLVLYVIWRLRERRRVNIRLGSVLGGFAVFWLAFVAGAAAGVPWGATLVVSLMGWVAASLVLMVYLLLWRAGGGTVKGWRMPW